MTNWVKLQHPLLKSDLAIGIHDHGDHIISKTLAEKGIWEHYETTLICQNLKTGDCFLDIGANIGYFSLIAGSIVGEKGQVFCFEPEQRNFNLLESAIKRAKMPQVQYFPYALSNSEGTLDLFLSRDNFGDHQLYHASGYNDDRETQSVNTVIGDRFLINLGFNFNQPIFIKIDTQGAEYMIIDGLRLLINQCLPNLKMIIEFWPAGIRRSGYSAYDLLDLLLTFNLPIFIIDHIEHRLIPSSKQDLSPWVDALYAEPDNDGFMNLFIGHPL